MNKMWILIALLLGHPVFAADNLPKLNVDPQGITVSGVSSGAYMAMQMQVAFSEVIAGAASIAGGTFWCSEGDKIKAQINCMGQPSLIRSEVQINEAKRLAAANEIDALSNLAHKNIYIYASRQDFIIKSGNSDKLIEFLSSFMDRQRITYEEGTASAHGFPTLDFGAACGTGMSPWLLKCQLDTAGNILRTMYGNLSPRGAYNSGHLKKFSQGLFGDAHTPLFGEGWIYIPEVCALGQQCKLHIALHGCQMNPEYIQDQFAVHAGYNEWAESNGIVVLYPQSAKIAGDNPYACWDWFGFTGKNYVTKGGAQMAALRAMIRQLSGI